MKLMINHQQIMLDKIKDQSLNYEDMSNLYFALAKVLSMIKKILKNLYTLYSRKLMRLSLKPFNDYNFEIEKIKFKQISEIILKIFNFKIKSNNKGKNLIFIVGLPRSGTTLLHQIISSHSKVFGAEESHFLSDYLWRKI